MTSFMNQDNIGPDRSVVGTAVRKSFEELNSYIKITDSDDASGLVNFCYVNDPPNGEELEQNRELITSCRGLCLINITISCCKHFRLLLRHGVTQYSCMVG